jgi:micrococcal nuclease
MVVGAYRAGPRPAIPSTPPATRLTTGASTKGAAPDMTPISGRGGMGRRQRPPRRAGIGELVLGVGLLMAVMVAALHGRGWIAALFHLEPQKIVLVAGPMDHESGHFGHCHGPVRITCVVDGDTIWYQHQKIRLSDINAPEVSEPACDYELELGEKATDRMLELLNQGRFSLVPLPGRDADVYGRKLRAITRGGRSLGGVLVAEGLAERWMGYRRDWCS